MTIEEQTKHGQASEVPWMRSRITERKASRGVPAIFPSTRRYSTRTTVPSRRRNAGTFHGIYSDEPGTTSTSRISASGICFVRKSVRTVTSVSHTSTGDRKPTLSIRTTKGVVTNQPTKSGPQMPALSPVSTVYIPPPIHTVLMPAIDAPIRINAPRMIQAENRSGTAEFSVNVAPQQTFFFRSNLLFHDRRPGLCNNFQPTNTENRYVTK